MIKPLRFSLNGNHLLQIRVKTMELLMENDLSRPDMYQVDSKGKSAQQELHLTNWQNPQGSQKLLPASITLSQPIPSPEAHRFPCSHRGETTFVVPGMVVLAF